MSWLEKLAALEALEDAPLDASLVAEFEIFDQLHVCIA